jgi:hypothetical protein
MPPSNAPETTRQRMIGLLYIMLLCMLALNVSSDVLGGFELVEDSLLKSTHNSSIQNKSLYDDLYASYLQNTEKIEELFGICTAAGRPEAASDASHREKRP